MRGLDDGLARSDAVFGRQFGGPFGRDIAPADDVMRMPAPAAVPTALWNVSNAEERQALLDAPPPAQPTAPPPPEPAPPDPAVFLGMLGEVTFPAGQEDVFEGQTQESVSVDSTDSFTGFGISPQASSAKSLGAKEIAALKAAGIPVEVKANGSAYLPSLGGYAVPASSGIGVPLGQALAAGSASAALAATASGASGGRVSGGNAPSASGSDIVVTAQTRPASSGNLSATSLAALMTASPGTSGRNQAAAPANAPVAQEPATEAAREPAQPLPVAEPASENIIVTGDRSRGKSEPWQNEVVIVSTRAQLDRQWVGFNQVNATHGERSDHAALVAGFDAAYERITLAELEAKAVQLDTIRTVLPPLDLGLAAGAVLTGEARASDWITLGGAALGGVGARLLSTVGKAGAVDGIVVNEALAGTALARKLGNEGEALLGITVPKVGITVPGTGQMRFPDEINLKAGTLTEVKNVAYQSWTSQLRDYATVARAEGLTFNLIVRENTRISSVLDTAVNRGDAVLLRGLPAK